MAQPKCFQIGCVCSQQTSASVFPWGCMGVAFFQFMRRDLRCFVTGDDARSSGAGGRSGVDQWWVVRLGVVMMCFFRNSEMLAVAFTVGGSWHKHQEAVCSWSVYCVNLQKGHVQTVQ